MPPMRKARKTRPYDVPDEKRRQCRIVADEEQIKKGRPPKEIDVDQLISLAHIQCTMQEMASIMDVSLEYLDTHFPMTIKKAQEDGKCSLRRTQWKMAMDGSVPMAIFLGKVLLKQREEDAIDKQAVNDLHEIFKGVKNMRNQDAGTAPKPQ